jgi:predicted nucleic acid-binding Zn ribbon protein
VSAGGGTGRGRGRGSRASGRGRREDPTTQVRRAGWEDRDEHLYARKRARQARDRAKQDRKAFDPAPPADEDWTVAEEETDGLRRIRPPTAIGESLEALVRRRGWDERLRATTAWSRWEDIVGPELAGRCEPVRLAGGTLVIRAESQVWATQLRYLTTQLLTNARTVLGEHAVRELRFTVGPLQGEPAAE